MRTLAVALTLAALVPATAQATSDGSLRCAGGLVSVGDATVDLLGKCGAPKLREVRAYEAGAVGTLGPRSGRASVLTTEKWTYDFGPQQFLMFVTVDGGKIVAIDRGGYGYVRPEEPSVPIRRATCETNALHVGDAKVDLLARCGEPALMEMRLDDLALADPHGGLLGGRAAPREVEVWTYDFGPQSFVRFVILADGVVVRIETGGRGYAR